MAAYGDVASLLNNIELMMAHPRLSTSVDKNQIQSLYKKADDLLNFIITNNYGVGTKEAEDLERQIASAARVAEDVIESHDVDQIHAQQSNQATPECLLDLQQIIEDMDVVMKKAAEVGEKWQSREEQPTHHHMEKATERQPLTTTGEMSPVGLDEDTLKLMDLLCLEQPKLHLISIVGMGGSGKTTLARNVYDNLLIKENFEIRAWATVSQQYSAQVIHSQLLSCIGKISGNGQELYQTLFGRKYLIILDDIWNVEPWNEMRQFFPDNGNGSRVVLSTRLSGVARDCLSFCFMMNLLDEDRSWKLLCKKTFQQENCPNSELENVGKEIASLCRGLPLSIVVIGGLLLNSSRTVGFWEGVAKNIKSLPNAKEKQESLDVLSLSYNHLPPHLKPCFLYMGVFEEDYVIRVSRIIKLWVSEGFIRPNCAQVLEEIAEDYLYDLISRNLVLVLVDEFGHGGKIRYCRIHDLIRDLCLNLAQQQDFFNVMIDGANRGTECRLVCEDELFELGPPLARSIMARNNHKQPIKYKLLKVLDENGFEPRPQVFGNVNLRYLAYQHDYDRQPMRELPTSFSFIWNLQTLIFTLRFMVVAPIEIWKMRQLRHVICDEIYVPDPPPSNEQDKMENLQTLTSVMNFIWSEEVCKILPNIKKLSLIYDCKSHGYNDNWIECLCYLDRFKGLESLKMDFDEGTSQHTELNRKLAFPASLHKLTLRNSKLHWDDLTIIDSLPHLQVLILGWQSVTEGQKWSPVPGQFLQLKFLTIEKCALVCWDADNSHFLILEKLVLRYLHDLKEIPLGIGDIPTLGFISIEYCRKFSLVISAMRIKEDLLEDQGIDSLQIQVKVHLTWEDSFRKGMEKEGLKMNAIQFQGY